MTAPYDTLHENTIQLAYSNNADFRYHANKPYIFVTNPSIQLYKRFVSRIQWL